MLRYTELVEPTNQELQTPNRIWGWANTLVDVQHALEQWEIQ